MDDDVLLNDKMLPVVMLLLIDVLDLMERERERERECPP